MQEIVLNLSQDASLYSVVRLFSNYTTKNDTHLKILYDGTGFVPSEVYPVVCSFMNEVKKQGYQSLCTSDVLHGCIVMNYASRIDFFKNLEIPYVEYFSRHGHSSKFIEITNAPKNCYGISHCFSEIFSEGFGLTEEEAYFVGFFIDEMIGNVTMHSKSESGAYFYCQKYPSKGGLEIIIADSGIGISRSLQRINPNQINAFYLSESIKFGVTNGEGRGHGLYFISEFLRRNDGIFELWSGGNYLKILHGHEVIHNCLPWKGVILKFFIKFDIKVTLNQLFKEKGYQ